MFMFKRSQIILCAALLCIASDAKAADLPQPVAVAVAQKAVATSVTNGVYFGATGVAAKTRANFGSGDVTPTGTMAGAVVGYALYAGQALFAIEADAQYSIARQSKDCANDVCDMKPTWLMSQRLVFGMPLTSLTGAAQRAASVPSSQWPTPLNAPATLASATAMPYLTAGIAERRFQTCIDAAACERGWHGGWATGGGFRVPVSAGFTADIGYLYIGYRKKNLDTVPMFVPASEQVIKASLHYHM